MLDVCIWPVHANTWFHSEPPDRLAGARDQPRSWRRSTAFVVECRKGQEPRAHEPSSRLVRRCDDRANTTPARHPCENVRLRLGPVRVPSHQHKGPHVERLVGAPRHARVPCFMFHVKRARVTRRLRQSKLAWRQEPFCVQGNRDMPLLQERCGPLSCGVVGRRGTCAPSRFVE
jgi:hypothetical protein